MSVPFICWPYIAGYDMTVFAVVVVAERLADPASEAVGLVDHVTLPTVITASRVRCLTIITLGKNTHSLFRWQPSDNV